MCALLDSHDPKIIQVALNGLENILKVGEILAKQMNTINPYNIMIEECGGLDKIEQLQSSENADIYQKAFHLIETYFDIEDEDNFAQV